MIDHRRRALRTFCLSLCVCCIAAAAPAQGGFVNFELPSVEPIAVAKVGSAWYVLVCNGPDNAVEIYRAADNSFVTRVPVGQYPVTVRWSRNLSAFFTCNFLGDSITRVSLQPATGPLPIAATVDATRHVGDEPADIVLVDNATQALVTLSSSSALERIDTATLQSVRTAAIRLGDAADPLQQTRALKEPRRMSPAIDGSVAVLATRCSSNTAGAFDLGLLTLAFDSQGNVSQVVPQGQLGTSAFGMQRSADGRLWIVGNRAQNQVEDEPNLRAEPTGFVQSQLAVLDLPGTVGAVPRVRNLNLDAIGGVAGVGDAISMPTDVALFEPDGVVQRVFVASFCSDRIAVLEVTNGPATPPASWPLSTIDLRPAASGAYRNVGPRAFASKPADAAIPGDVARLYVANTLMPSFSVIDPANPTAPVITIALQQDPTPDVVRTGRKGLYDARISGTGFVACASCHLDGGTDGLAWRLEVDQPAPMPIPAGLLGDGINDQNLTPPGSFPTNKGRMVTQNLHGLVNHHVPGRAQELYSNKPYHWRGDRADFVAFNAAFVGLMGAPDLNPGGSPKGLSDAEMQAYREFIDTCAYPPNPEQPLNRRVSGSLGTADSEADGSGALRGQKLFHIKVLPGAKFASRSCVHCHMGAAGSNNRLTDLETFDPQPAVTVQPIETAALRSLRSREARIETGFGVMAQEIRTGEFGLTHAGPTQFRSINAFHSVAFSSVFAAGSPELMAVIEFTRQFDAGIAPIVGRSFTVDVGNVSTQAIGDALRLAESQVLNANAGLAVQVRGPTGISGWWFDATVSPPMYRQEGGTTWLTTAQLKALVAADTVLLVQSTPVGSERRIANPDGVATPLVDLQNPPADVVLEPLHAPTHWRTVPGLSVNSRVTWTGFGSKARSLQTLDLYQDALIQAGLIPGQRHEAVRRLCVSGLNLRPGARLELGIPTVTAQADPTFVIALPIFPTNRVNAAGRIVWETTAELDPLSAYQLLLGGPSAPGVMDALTAAQPGTLGTDIFKIGWNSFRVTVRNEDGTVTTPASSVEWQMLTID